MTRSYGDALSMREARSHYFRENGFGGDGGYSKAWVTAKLGPIPIVFPNTAGRVRAIWRAFLRGRHTRNLYRSEYDDALLDSSVGALRARLGCDRASGSITARPRDAAAFAGWMAAAIALGLATAAAIVAPVAWLVGRIFGAS